MLMLDIFYDDVKFIHLSRRRNIQQDNLIISNNEKKACKKRRFLAEFGCPLVDAMTRYDVRSSNLCAN